MQELIIQKNNNIKTFLLVENGIIIEKYIENDNFKRLEGNIYLRKSSKCFKWNASCICRYWRK